SSPPTPSTAPISTPPASAPPPPRPVPVVLGAYLPGAPSDPTRIDAYTALTGAVPRIVMWYQAWSGTANAFYPKGANAVRARGAMPLISWEPWAADKNDPQWSLSTIIHGKHDAYI